MHIPQKHAFQTEDRSPETDSKPMIGLSNEYYFNEDVKSVIVMSREHHQSIEVPN